MKKYGVFMVCLMAMVLGSCSSSSTKKGRSTSSSIGQPSEVLLVLDKEVMGSDLKDTLKALLECDMPGLNQSEPFFRVSRVPNSIYKGEMLKMHSKLLVQIDRKLEDCEVKLAYDVDAKPQIQMLLTAPTVENLRGYLAVNADRLRRILYDYQLSMQQPYLRKHYSKPLREAVKAMGYDALFPEEISYVKKGKNCVWGSSRTSEKQLNVVFYHYPSDGSELADIHRMAQVRDSVMQVNIPGSRPDQWMETVWEQDEPVAQLGLYQHEGETVTEIRGLWQMRNGAMGGPFVDYCWYDPDRHEVVVAEGFVFSPSTEKRDLVRRVEAGIRTIKRR